MNNDCFKIIRLDFETVTAEILLDLNAFKSNVAARADEKKIHFHTCAEIFFVGENELKIVSETETYVYKNAVVTIPPHFRHFSSIGENTYCFLLRFLPKKEKETPIFKRLNEYTSEGIHTMPNNERFRFYLREMHESDENAEIKTNALLTLVVFEYFKNLHVFREGTRQISSNDTKYLHLINQIVNADFSENVTLSYAAKRLHLSEKQTSRLIRKEYGMPLSKLRTDKKLAAAAMLLKNTNKSVAEIISELNFQTESYFFVLFKKRYGMTPLAYAKQK